MGPVRRSAAASVRPGIAIPGYLVWGALIYAIFGTTLTQRIGWPLVNLNFQQQRYEADFRFNLVRARENSEQIALLQGEAVERERLLSRFGLVVENWFGIMSRTKRLTAFTASYAQAAVIFPYMLVAPAYFAEKVQLGGMMQTASAFSSVQESLSFFVTPTARWPNGAPWSRVSTASRRRSQAPPHWRTSAIICRIVRRHQGDRPKQIGAAAERRAAGGRRRSSIRSRRAHAAHRAVGLRQVDAVPGHRRHLAVRRRHDPIPAGHADDAAAAALFSGRLAARRHRLSRRKRNLQPEQVSGRADAVGLPKLGSRLDEDAHWNRMLSLGEQQRFGIARALLHAPQYLFLDEATASLDEPSEAALYRCCGEAAGNDHRLDRPPLDAGGLPQRKVALVRDGDRFALRQAGGEAGAS